MNTGVSQGFKVLLCKDAQDAIAQGHNYRAWPVPPKPVSINEVVLVKKGTEAGNGTVEFVMVDADGNKYVTMTTARLLKTALQAV